LNDLQGERPGPIVVLGAPEDNSAAERVMAGLKGPAVNLCGKTTLPIMGSLLRTCAVLLTNESGLMHMAWAAGIPVVAAAGPSNPFLTSPFGSRIRILQRTEVPCVPCVKNECYRLGAGRMACMKAIGAEEASAAAGELLGN
jgi:ADP-heptose:LPS heptosyltransferase